MDLTNAQNLSSLETNNVFRPKLATARTSEHRNMQIWWRHFFIIKFLMSARYSRRSCLRITKMKNFFYWYVYFELYEFELLRFNIFWYYCIYVYSLFNSFLTFKFLLVYLRYNLGWEKYEQNLLNIEESLWNMKSNSIRTKIEEKVEDYRTRYPHYFKFRV